MSSYKPSKNSSSTTIANPQNCAMLVSGFPKVTGMNFGGSRG